MVAVTPSLLYGNKYFIFREKGIEVEIDILKGNIITSTHLTKEETDYFMKILN